MKIVIREVLFFFGYASACYGLFLVYRPVAFVLGGIFMMWLVAPRGKKMG